MPRQIMCPRCKAEGAVPEGYETQRIRCPNPACRHVFEITPGSEPAAESDVYALASQIQLRGGDPDRDLVLVSSRDGRTVAEDDLIAAMTDESTTRRELK